ncbi:hypothetical protein O1611_g5217 [Lasiodiplodia mahajangana]|uniref:Uncharacterized protein n=1 Tax=Lasiodiplodia mahajangana TaxID=1108764 RepID=A0ACC2JLS5_9PEZI|nr:hypothetical protein O1611_g5217 [Lasiodiplodia mahajangana]
MSENTGVSIKADPACDSQTSTTSDDGTKFAWTHCAETDAQLRLSIKEHSLKIGFDYCEKLINTLEEAFSNIAKHSKNSAEAIWPQNSRDAWISECRDIINHHKDFKVLVGVAGATGSGKTSALNALLGFQELLPTNNEEAATAVHCKVAFNDDRRPEYAFRCHVTFQSKESMTTRLERFFDDLENRNAHEESHDGSAEDEEALRSLESLLRPTREMISIVFGLQRDQVEKMSVEEVLKSNPEAVNLLGTVKEFHTGNVGDISQIIKPYMDSTVADHSTSGSSFAAWPLIEKVELFVKSDILQNGVALVDLPGLGDAVESRALVAEKSFDQLTATMIVAQATRAADNSTAVNLMSEYQEIAMMMDGKFHKKTFCVCLSQIDQIDRKAALRKPDAKANADLQGWLEEEDTQKRTIKTKFQKKKDAKRAIKKLRTLVKKHRKPLGKAGLGQDEVAAAKAALQQLKMDKRARKIVVAKISKEISKSKRRLIELDGLITFICIQERNQYLQHRISLDFRKRQARLVSKADKRQSAYDGRVTVCPTSAKAFWTCKSPIKRITGFPSEVYTGIPSLAGWIRSATVPKREEHADYLLNRLRAQFNILQLWSKDKCKLSDTPITKSSFEEDVLDDALSKMEKGLTAYWPLLAAEVHKKNPLAEQKEKLTQCPELCAKAVRGWAYKKPDDIASDAKVHWTTYQANLSRSGGKFVSKAKAATQEYNWMEDISNILFNTIVKNWDQSLNYDIPALSEDASREIDKIWDEFIMNLNANVQNTEPRLLPELANEKPSLDIIKTNTKNKLRRALRDISQRTFQDALGIKGSGAHTARQKLLLSFAAEKSRKMFTTAFNKLHKEVEKIFNALQNDLHSISDSSIQDIRRYISMLLDKVLEPEDLALKMEAVAEERAHLQQSVQAMIRDWINEWEHPTLSGQATGTIADQEIPLEYRHAQTELEQLEDDDIEANSDSDSDSDSETEFGTDGEDVENENLPSADGDEDRMVVED